MVSKSGRHMPGGQVLAEGVQDGRMCRTAADFTNPHRYTLSGSIHFEPRSCCNFGKTKVGIAAMIG
jgi:hypothetical protein